VIGQVMGESITMGVIGGIVGVGLGFAGSKIVTKVAPALSASVGQTTGSATPGGARTFPGGGGFPGGGFPGGGFPGGGFPGRGAGFRAASAAPSTTVHLTAPVNANIIILAVALAVAGGLIAGMLGGWRAARLRPAAALARVE
jgi:putative ABC transport system permease protein